jgi:hypothetical protein
MNLSKSSSEKDVGQPVLNHIMIYISDIMGFI